MRSWPSASELADIAGVEPAVCESARGFLGSVEVAAGHVLAAHEDFAIVGDFDFDAADGFADAAFAGVEGMIERDDRARFR